MKKFIIAITIVLSAIQLSCAQTETKKEKALNVDEKSLATATFAGGCFWCMEPPFEELDGVYTVVSGYIGGQKKNPNYQEVSAGTTGHTEAVEIRYDSTVITYEQLLYVFWRNIDPTTLNAQFADKGTQYRTGIFYHNEEQKKLAEQSKKDLAEKWSV